MLLLDDGVEDQQTGHPTTTTLSEAPRMLHGQHVSPPTLNEWADFLDSSTQIAREIADDKTMLTSRNTPIHPPPRARSFRSVPSWTSDDAFDDHDEPIDASAVEHAMHVEAQRLEQARTDKLLMPPPGRFIKSKAKDQASMLPPPPPPPPRLSASAQGAPTHQPETVGNIKPTPSLASYGISAADLESLAADEILLSQWPGG